MSLTFDTANLLLFFIYLLYLSAVVALALQLISISLLFRPRLYEYAVFSAVSRVALGGCSAAVSEASAQKTLICESLKARRETFPPERSRSLCPDVGSSVHT